ncbi:hypothetical protein B566_EDAN003500 [Ephemera danica]|nr:hypothetical protein B566_EDAN003500 [Ephemera danica]
MMFNSWGSLSKEMVANVNDVDRSSPQDGIDYKVRYRNLKRKLKFLIFENESFQEVLRSTQQRLLKASRDRSFLLDRLLQYEKVEASSSDSDETESSDDQEPMKPEPQKRKRLESTYSVSSPGASASASKPQPTAAAAAKKRKPVVAKVTIKQSSLSQDLPISSPMLADGHMTPEEVERHLESRQSYLELLPERAPPTVPTEMFSNEPSLDSFCYSESNEIGEVETSPSNLGEDCLSVDLPE